MFKQIAVMFVLAVASVNAIYGGYGGGYGGYGGGYGGYSSGYGAVPLAIKSSQYTRYYDVPSYGYAKPTNVVIEPSYAPINMLFKSVSSPLNVQQVHQGAPGSYQSSHSVDEPHKLFHQVTKPVIQEIREIVTPYRNIVQEIKPVVENIETIVARKAYGGGGLGGGIGLGGGLGGGYGYGKMGY